MAEIVICYLGDDGKPSLVYRPNCLGNLDAKRQALLQAGERFRSAEIWNELERVETIVFKHAA